jgi:hypothetical protein
MDLSTAIARLMKHRAWAERACSGIEPHSLAFLPLMPAERAVRRACALIADKHRRRNAGRTSAARAERMIGEPALRFDREIDLREAR